MGVVADQLQVLTREKVISTQLTLTVNDEGTYTVSVIGPGNSMNDVGLAQTPEQVALLVTEFTDWVADQWGEDPV